MDFKLTGPVVIDVATLILVATPVVVCYVAEPLFGRDMSLVELML